MLVFLIKGLLLFYSWNLCLFSYFINKISSWPIYHIGSRNNTIYSEALKTFLLLDFLSIFWSFSLTGWKLLFLFRVYLVFYFYRLFFMYFSLVVFIMTMESHQPGCQKLWMLIYSFNKYSLRALCVMHLLPFGSIQVF